MFIWILAAALVVPGCGRGKTPPKQSAAPPNASSGADEETRDSGSDPQPASSKRRQDLLAALVQRRLDAAVAVREALLALQQVRGAYDEQAAEYRAAWARYRAVRRYVIQHGGDAAIYGMDTQDWPHPEPPRIRRPEFPRDDILAGLERARACVEAFAAADQACRDAGEPAGAEVGALVQAVREFVPSFDAYRGEMLRP